MTILLSILAFVVLFSTLILVHEWGHYRAALWANVRVEEFGLGLGKKLYGYQRGETEFTLNAVPFGGFVRMTGEEDTSDDPRAFHRAPVLKRMVITLAGVIMNWVFAFAVLVLLFTLGTRPFVISDADMQRAEDQGLVTFSVDAETGERVITDIQDIKLPLHQAVPFAATETVRISGAVLGKVAEIPGEIMRTGDVPEGLSGPLGIAEVTHQVTPYGVLALLRLAALLSISLAVMNLMPIPALDGGLLVFQIVELVIGKKPAPVFENLLHYFGFFLLMGFLVIITWHDIVRIFFS